MIQVSNVHKVYEGADRPVQALKGIHLTVQKGEFAALMGRSGCGKSTLLHLLGGLDRPTQGEIIVNGHALHAMRDKEITRLRRREIAVVFQFFNLLPTLTVLENVTLPLVLQQGYSASVRRKAVGLLESVGLANRRNHGLHQLSGGEQQRTAIVRSLMIEPQVLLADEPTGNLDSESEEVVMGLLERLPREFGTTVVMATHNRELGERCDRLLVMRDGVMENQE